MTEENKKILKKAIRQRRAISSNLWENGSYNESEEERNKSKNSVKSFHRKTTTSYFYGSYLSSNLENDLYNNLNIDEIINDKKNDDSITNNQNSKEKNTSLNSNKEDNFEAINNVSFHSYELDSNHNSTPEKIEENSNGNIINGTIKNGQNIINKDNTNIEEKDNKCIVDKSFVPFKNHLKYIIDKEERATKSYLLALGMTTNQNKNNEKEQYLPTASVIEEEKSDLIDSRSEFSNRKKSTKKNFYLEDSLNNTKNVIMAKKESKPNIKNNLDEKNKDKKNDINDNENGCIKNKNITYVNINGNISKNIHGKRDDNNMNGNQKFNNKMSDALNEIISKNHKKEENKRKYLKKNKIILLNSFFNMTYKGKLSEMDIDNETKENNKTVFKKTENNNQEGKASCKIKIEKKFPFLEKRKKLDNFIISNMIKKRYNTENNSENLLKSNHNTTMQNKINSKFMLNSDKKNMIFNNLNNSINSNLNSNLTSNLTSNLNTQNSSNKTFIMNENKIKSKKAVITKIEYRPRSRIPHLRQKIMDKKEMINNNINSVTITKNKELNKKYLTKIMNIPHKKTHSFTKDKIFMNENENISLQSMKQMKTINKAFNLIRIGRLNSKNKNKTLSKKSTNSINNKNKHSNSSSFTGATRSNSKSSRSKDKNIIVNKANSSSFNYKNESSSSFICDEKSFRCSNKKYTVIALKENLIYSKSYIKIDVLEKIIKTFNSDSSFFIIFCEKYIKVNNDNNYGDNIQNENFILLFKSLMKYYKNQNRFIKIYGDQRAPNVISVKNININNYCIYQTKCFTKQNKDINDISLIFEPVNEIKFTTNAIILSKK